MVIISRLFRLKTSGITVCIRTINKFPNKSAEKKMMILFFVIFYKNKYKITIDKVEKIKDTTPKYMGKFSVFAINR